MLDYLKKDRWSPYIAGGLIGVLSWMLFFFLENHIGTTGCFQQFGAIIVSIFAPEHVAHSNYYMRFFQGGIISFQMAFVIAIFFGSLFASKLSKTKKKAYVPAIWAKNFGKEKWKRNVGAFIGGFILLFGARLAGGCTSGHAISGGMQLAVTSWIFVLAVFFSAITTSMIIYRKS